MSKHRLLTTGGGTLKNLATAVAGSIRHILAFSQVFTAEDARALLSGQGFHVFDDDYPSKNRRAEQNEKPTDTEI